MPEIRVLTEADIRTVVGLGDDELAAIEDVYPLISGGSASMPAVQRIDVPDHNGEIDIKSAYLPGRDSIAVKVSAGFFDNPSRGLPSLGGLVLLFDARTGVPQAALFDNGLLTDLRTALGGAVAARHLARDDATTVGVIGAGVQARLQVEALSLVRQVTRALVWARRDERARTLADELAHLGVEATAVDTPAAAATADVLVTTTPSTSPLIDADMLHAGLHVTTVGADAEHKQELAASAISAADVVVCDHRGQSRRLGELRTAPQHDVDRALELGEIVGGRRPGRISPDQVTICDLTGTGAQDTAIATLALHRCEQAGLGTTVRT